MLFFDVGIVCFCLFVVVFVSVFVVVCWFGGCRLFFVWGRCR